MGTPSLPARDLLKKIQARGFNACIPGDPQCETVVRGYLDAAGFCGVDLPAQFRPDIDDSTERWQWLNSYAVLGGNDAGVWVLNRKGVLTFVKSDDCNRHLQEDPTAILGTVLFL